MFGKIVDGNFVQAPKNLNNILNFDKDEALMHAHGFKPVIEATRPDAIDGFFAVARYTDNGETIVQTWEQIAILSEEAI